MATTPSASRTTTTSGAPTSRISGAGPCWLQGPAPAHAGDRGALLHAQPGRRPAAGGCRPAQERRRHEPVDLPAHRRAAQLQAGRLRQRHLPRQLADDRLHRGHRSSTCPRPSRTALEKRPPTSPIGVLLAADRGPTPRRRQGFPGLRLRGDVTGTADGLAMAPYIREGRRIRAGTRVVEQDVSHAVRGDTGALHYRDSVGVGMYRIDLHPSTGGDNYIDVPVAPVRDPARRAAARGGSRTCCRPARTSAPPTSPTAATGCTRSSGTSARPPACWRRIA